MRSHLASLFSPPTRLFFLFLFLSHVLSSPSSFSPTPFLPLPLPLPRPFFLFRPLFHVFSFSFAPSSTLLLHFSPFPSPSRPRAPRSYTPLLAPSPGPRTVRFHRPLPLHLAPSRIVDGSCSDSSPRPLFSVASRPDPPECLRPSRARVGCDAHVARIETPPPSTPCAVDYPPFPPPPCKPLPRHARGCAGPAAALASLVPCRSAPASSRPPFVAADAPAPATGNRAVRDPATAACANHRETRAER